MQVSQEVYFQLGGTGGVRKGSIVSYDPVNGMCAIWYTVPFHGVGTLTFEHESDLHDTEASLRCKMGELEP